MSRVDPFVLAEHEAARQLRLARRHPPAEARLGALADLVAVGQRQRDHDSDRRARPAATGARARTALRLQAGAQRLHRRRPDPAHLVELVDRGEAAVLVAELDDVAAVTGPIPSIVSSCSTVACRG